MDSYNDILLGMAITDIDYKVLYVDGVVNETFPHRINMTKGDDLCQLFPDVCSKNEMIITSHEGKLENVLIKKSPFVLGEQQYFCFLLIDLSLDQALSYQIEQLNQELFIDNEMFNILDDGIYMTDELGNTIYVNDAFVNMSGLSRNQLIGKNVMHLESDKILPNSCCRQVIELRQPIITINNYYQGQKCLVSGFPIYDSDGMFKRTIAVVRDVSELDMLMKQVSAEKSIALGYAKTIKPSQELEIKAEYKKFLTPKMRQIYKEAERIAHMDTTVLITGETGVGKDFLATFIHAASKEGTQKRGELIKINCGAIPEHLLESELFGYESGAFTGAGSKGKIGLFEMAKGGTLFLDEIGDMPYTLQVKLLSVLNDRQFYKVGGTKPIALDSKIIVATNIDLREKVLHKEFRADLFYRINVITFHLPPLRERRQDILSLAKYFLNVFNNKFNKNNFFTSDVMEGFLKYHWPGNIREMKNIIERLVLMSEKNAIDLQMFTRQLPQYVDDFSIDESSDKVMDMFNRSSQYEASTENDAHTMSLKERVGEFESKVIRDVLMQSANMKEAAEILKIDISTLVRKKKKYKI